MAEIQVLSILSNDESTSSLRKFLAEARNVSSCGEATSDSDALQKLAETDVDVVLLDLAVRTVDPIQLTKQIRQSHPKARVVICTAFRRSSDIFSALDAGADGYVLKDNHKGLESALSSVRLGAVWLDPGIASQVLDAMAKSSLGQTPMRTLPTGRMPIPLFPHEKDLLHQLAGSDCADGVCMIDPAFLKKLRRFAPE
jgi:DNA-binding NarL/FixJ family response regulator